MSNKKGFTLLELLICISLIGVIMIFLFRLINDVQKENIANTYIVENQVNRNEIISKLNIISEAEGICGIDPYNEGNNKTTVNVLLCSGKNLTLTITNDKFKIDYDGEVSTYKMNVTNAYYDPNYIYQEIFYNNYKFYKFVIKTEKKGLKSTNIDDIEMFGSTTNSTFSCSNGEVVFEVPKAGYYLLEGWGAQGGSYNDTWHGGYGGYAKGAVYLNKGQKVYINVGCSGEAHDYWYGAGTSHVDGGYNGGGAANFGLTYDFYGSGGGATSFSLESGQLHESTTTSTFNNILLVAGGGAGAYYYSGSISAGAESVVGGNGGGGPQWNKYDGRTAILNNLTSTVTVPNYAQLACTRLYGTYNSNNGTCTLPYTATEEIIDNPPTFPFRYVDKNGSDAGRNYYTLTHWDGYTKTDHDVGRTCDTFYLSSNTLNGIAPGGGGGFTDGHFGCMGGAISSDPCASSPFGEASRAAACQALVEAGAILAPNDQISSDFIPTAMHVDFYASEGCGHVVNNSCEDGCTRTWWSDSCCGSMCTTLNTTILDSYQTVNYSKNRFVATGGSSYVKSGMYNASYTEKNETNYSLIPVAGYMKKGNGYASIRYVGTSI